LSIIHVLSSYAVGGGEQVALNIAAAQIRKGHDVHVVALSQAPDGPHAENFRRAGVTTHRVPRRGPTLDPSLPARLAWLFRRLGVNVVHTHNPLPIIYAGPAARLARVALVHTKHGFNQALARRTWLRKLVGSTPHAFTAVSEQPANDALLQHDCPPDRLRVIPNGIDLSRYSPDAEARQAVRAELGIPEDAWVIGTVGRMSIVKNQPLLVRAAAPLLSDKCRLVLVGDGENRPSVEAEVRRAPRPEYIHLLGQRLDAPRLLASFDVFALPSKSEGLPMVLPEAMATGLPIVSTAVGGIPEVVAEGKSGHLVPPDSEVALRECLAMLSENRAHATECGVVGRGIALDRYSAEKMVERYMNLYRYSLSRSLGSRPQPTLEGA
jgi:glycosyltransferase involved in cell wall biosynthesis